MTKIEIYDNNLKFLKKWAEEEDTTIAEVVDELIALHHVHIANENED